MVEGMSVFSGDTEGIAGRYGTTGITWEAQMDNVRMWSVMLLWVSSHLYFWAHHFKFYALPCWNQVVWCVTKRFTSKSEAAVQVSVVTKASYCFQKTWICHSVCGKVATILTFSCSFPLACPNKAGGIHCTDGKLIFWEFPAVGIAPS